MSSFLHARLAAFAETGNRAAYILQYYRHLRRFNSPARFAYKQALLRWENDEDVMHPLPPNVLRFPVKKKIQPPLFAVLF